VFTIVNGNKVGQDGKMLGRDLREIGAPELDSFLYVDLAVSIEIHLRK
jgi:hypothetical protein